MKRRKIITISFLVIILFLVITNPGMKSFKDFLDKKMVNQRRVSNYLIFSVYQCDEPYNEWNGSYDYRSKKYIGIVLNFYPYDSEN